MKEKNITTGKLAELLGANLEGDGNILLKSAKSIETAKAGNISFLSDYRYEKYLYHSDASAVLVKEDFVPKSDLRAVLIRVKDMDTAKYKMLRAFQNKKEEEKEATISENAFISASATIGESVTLGHFGVIADGARIGNHTKLGDQVSVGENVIIGNHCEIHSGVKIYHDCVIGDHVIIHANTVIGSDGFGFLPDENGEYQKISQIGIVIIEDQVEIGSNCVVDRATIGETVLEKGVKLDNLVQIAHNVRVKKHTVMAAQSGIAGSSTVGAHCVIGGQVGIIGHLTIADGTQIQGQSGVISNVKKKNSKLYGTPAIDYNNYLRSYAVFKQLPKINVLLRKISRYLPTFKKVE